jgi:hypothetical protein
MLVKHSLLPQGLSKILNSSTKNLETYIFTAQALLYGITAPSGSFCG